MENNDFFILRFAHQHLNFRIAEYRAISELFGNDIFDTFLDNIDTNNDLRHLYKRTPFIPIKNMERIDQIVSRSILIKNAYHCIARAKSRKELVEKVKNNPLVSLIMTRKEQDSASFKFIVDTFGKRFTLEEQVAMINEYSFLSLGGPVRMNNPDITFCIAARVRDENDRLDDDLVEEWYFGRLIQESDRHAIDVFDLKKRLYIGTTSMDAELSLLMCNLAKIKYGSIVYDPFVGTGGLLLSSAHFGAFAVGSDIDGRQLRGKDGINIQSNIQQYGLKDHVLDTFICDITCHPLRYINNGLFDAIITDPPYGVRAGAKKIASNPLYQLEEYPMNDPMCPTYPRTDPYPTQQVIHDLIEFSSKYLVLGGRLVYWQPTLDANIDIPHHPSMKLIDALEQQLAGWSRWLIVMEKTEYIPSNECNDIQNNWINFRQLLFNKPSS